YTVLGLIKPQNYTCDTPDGAGKTILDAKRRIARVVCADLSEITDKEIFSIARQVKEAQVSDIKDALCEISKKHGIRRIVACGLGEFLAKKAAIESGFEIILISERYGTEISKVFPAYAVAKLLKDCDILPSLK
ncbi:MAG TPA: hydantoinase/oxoprolinase family protein, partial [Candidatus Methanoperedens sp.]